MELEREYLVKKVKENIDQLFEKSGSEKREATARKGKRIKV